MALKMRERIKANGEIDCGKGARRAKRGRSKKIGRKSSVGAVTSFFLREADR